MLEPTRVACPSSLVDRPIGATHQPLSVLTSNDSAAGLGAMKIGRERSSRYKYLSALERSEPAPWRGTVAFDDDSWTFWRPATRTAPGDYWLAVDMGSETRLRSVSLLPGPRLGSAGQGASPDIEIQATNRAIDDGDWTTLAVLRPGEILAGAGDRAWQRVAVDAMAAYRYYRLRSDDPASLSLREVRLDIGYNHAADIATVTPDGLLAAGGLVVDRNEDGRTVLRPAGRELHVAGMLEIPADHALELPAGSTLRFAPGAGLLAYGAVRALGTEEAPVRLVPAKPAEGFKGIAVVGAKQPSVFRHAVVTGARGGFFGPHQISGGLSIYRSSAEISHSRFADIAANDGLHISYSVFSISDSRFVGSASDTIDIDWSFGSVSRTELSACGAVSGDCIDLSGSRVDLDEVAVRGASDKGLSIGEGSVAEARGLAVSDSRIAVAVKDSGSLEIDGCRIAGNAFGVVRYIKKPTYAYPALRLEGCELSANAVARLDEPKDIWTRRHD